MNAMREVGGITDRARPRPAVVFRKKDAYSRFVLLVVMVGVVKDTASALDDWKKLSLVIVRSSRRGQPVARIG